MMNLYESNRMQGDYVDEYLTELQVQQISSMLNTYQTLWLPLPEVKTRPYARL